MDRKGIIAVALALITLLVWQQHYTDQMRQYAEAEKAKQKVTEEAAKAAEQAANPTPATAAPTTPAASGTTAPATPTPVVPEQTREADTPSAKYFFTSQGGGVRRVVLPEHLGQDERPIELNQFESTPIGAVSELPGQGTLQPWQMGPESAGEVSFERTDARGFRVRKKFTLPQGDAPKYVAKLELTYEATGATAVPLPMQYLYTGSAAPLHAKDAPNNTGFGWMQEGNFNYKYSGQFYTGGFWIFGRNEVSALTESVAGGDWAGVTNQYFTTLITPRGTKGTGIWMHRIPIEAAKIGEPGSLPAFVGPADQTPHFYAIEGAIQLAAFNVEPGKPVTYSFDVYTGPREYTRLKALGDEQDKILEFGRLAWVSKTLLISMNWLHSKLGSYAIAIVVLTLIIRGLMWPLQNKATREMKRMQALTPEMNKLREKYADDPERMNRELMGFYKSHKLNPFGGCLPALVQMPIFFGFYTMLGRAVELRNTHFLWVKDLSQPDTVGHFLGFPINLLPLCMLITMVGQMQLTPKSGDPVQQRMTMLLPLVFIFFCYQYASALALYFTVQNIFSMVQLYVTRNSTTPVLQKIETPVKRVR